MGKARQPEEPEPEVEETVEEEVAAEAETDEPDKSEFETMMKDWVATGQDIQSQQIKAFDALFHQATQNMMSGKEPDET